MNKLKLGAITNLAKMICGDEPYSYFKYRSSSYLTDFFKSVNLDYRHDGSTRSLWVQSVLKELNEKESLDEDLPPKEIISVIEYLLHPDHFIRKSAEQQKAIEAVNEILKSYELEIELNPKTSIPKLKSTSANFVSSAVEEYSIEQKITFVPSVFKSPKIKPDERLVAVMMPFSAEFNNVYSTIKNACISVGLRCHRADDMWINSTFVQDIFELIYAAKIIIVDFTGRNPNVFYETGISHTLGKIVIPITQSLSDIPSDLQAHRVLVYLLNNEGLLSLEEKLRKKFMTILEGYSLS